MATRDDFSQDTIRKLGDRVGLLCSNPDCRAPAPGSGSCTRARSTTTNSPLRAGVGRRAGRLASKTPAYGRPEGVLGRSRWGVRGGVASVFELARAPIDGPRLHGGGAATRMNLLHFVGFWTSAPQDDPLLRQSPRVAPLPPSERPGCPRARFRHLGRPSSAT